MALPKARAARVPRRPTRTCAKTAEQASSPVKAPKITEPPRICVTIPGQLRPASALPAHPLTAGRTLTWGTPAAGRGQARVLNQAAHAAIDATLPA